MNDVDKNSIVATAKDSLFGSIINASTSGVSYIPIRNKSDMVVAVFVIRENITNASGVHIGLSFDKIEQIYSAPKVSSGINLKFGTLARSLLNIDWIEDTNVSCCTYNSNDSDEQMDMIFCDDSLKMIIIK